LKIELLKKLSVKKRTQFAVLKLSAFFKKPGLISPPAFRIYHQSSFEKSFADNCELRRALVYRRYLSIAPRNASLPEKNFP